MNNGKITMNINRFPAKEKLKGLSNSPPKVNLKKTETSNFYHLNTSQLQLLFFQAIIFPFRFTRLEMRQTLWVMLGVWILAVSISGLPLADIDYFKDFYGRSGVCLALHITPDKPNGWEYSVFVFLGKCCPKLISIVTGMNRGSRILVLPGIIWLLMFINT